MMDPMGYTYVAPEGDGSITLPPGEYWIGDPCYAIEDEDWHDYLKGGVHASFRNRNSAMEETPAGTLHKGHLGVIMHTAYGDGHYTSNTEDSFGVDAGVLGAIPVEWLNPARLLEYLRLGSIHTFKEPARCSYTPEGGLVTLGPLVIYTGDDTTCENCNVELTGLICNFCLDEGLEEE